MLIDQQTMSFLDDSPHGQVELVVAIAARRSKHFARETLRMDADERNAVDQVAQHEGESGFRPGGCGS